MFLSYSDKISRTGTVSSSIEKPAKRHKMYNCDLCDGESWLSETDLELHKKETHFEIIFKQMEDHRERFCTICMKLQKNHSTLISHLKTRHLYSSPNAKRIEREIFICDECDHIFFNKDVLHTHMLYSHMWPTSERNKKFFTCPKCKKLRPLKTIWFHLQLHEIPNMSSCDICLTPFDSVSDLEEHLKIHPMYYKCEICNYHTTKDTHFETHLVHHHKTPFQQRTVVGKLAKEAFRRPSSARFKYNIHHSLRGMDLPRGIHICTLCREICTDKIEVRNHLVRDHMGIKEIKKPIRCLCGAEFSSRVLMKQHIFKEKEGEHREISENEFAQLVPRKPPQTKNIEVGEPASPEQYIVIEDEPEEAEEPEAAEAPAVDAPEVQKTPDEQLKYIFENIEEATKATSQLPKLTPKTIPMETEEVDIPEQFIIIEEGADLETEDQETAGELKAEQETTTVDQETTAVDQETTTVDQLSYMYAEVDEDQLVTIDSVTNEEVISF